VIITGHTVHTGGGTFDNLHDLARGDHIRVATSRGPVDYRVTSVRDDSKRWLAAHAGRVFSQTVAGRLALVTCTDWTGTTYLSNTVVLASPMPR
jgi:LPXTG-site transpeptidase (sortase) family protein